MEKFTIWEIVKDYRWTILGVFLVILAFLTWNEEEPGFSIVFGIFGFILIMKSLGN